MYWFLFICAGMLSSGGTSKKRLYQGHDSKIFGHLEICFVFFVVFLNVLCVYTLGLNDWFNVRSH